MKATQKGPMNLASVIRRCSIHKWLYNLNIQAVHKKESDALLIHLLLFSLYIKGAVCANLVEHKICYLCESLRLCVDCLLVPPHITKDDIPL